MGPTERLLFLAKALENWIPSKDLRFGMGRWSKSDVSVRRRGTYYEGHFTTQTVCAIGYALSLKEFQDQGFTQRAYFPTYYRGWSDSFANWEAVQKFFQISAPVAQELFHPGFYSNNVQPKDIAIRILEHVEALS